MKLVNHLNSSYIDAMNRLGGKRAQRRVVAYVESYEDISFWSHLLSRLATPTLYFEVMLPSRQGLAKGKKVALANDLGPRLGNCMIACVDADYDYLMQGATPTSQQVCFSPYVFHTYAYAIENHQCYAPALRQVCVQATLNDHDIFDFEGFLAAYSEAIYPLFIWNVWCYRYGHYKRFAMADFYHIVQMPDLNIFHPERYLEQLRHRVNAKVAHLQRLFPEGRKTYKPLRQELAALGLTPETTYQYMRGHDLYDGIVVPLLTAVCQLLRGEREREIKQLADHEMQRQNELAGYQNAVVPVEEMLRKHTGYESSPLYRRIVDNLRRLIDSLAQQEQTAPPTPPAD